MSLPRKQNRDEDERPVPHVPTWQPVESQKVGLRNGGTAEVAKFSRLSAQMVELSLQQTQRDATLDDTFPAEVSAAKPTAVSSPLPLPWPSTLAAPLHPPQPPGTPRESNIPNLWPNYWKEVRRNLDNWLVGARVRGSAAVRDLDALGKSAQKKLAALNIKSRYGTAPRLWTSTGVAALSAMLVVGVISGGRHYAYPHAYPPDTPQPRDRNTSPVIPAGHDISQPRPSSIVDTNGAAAMRHPARSSAAKHAAAKPQMRKTHRKDDAYVAKDTYVYYGKNGKPAR